MRAVTIHEARAMRAAHLGRVVGALMASARWFRGWRWARAARSPRARRHALYCRAMAVTRYDRALGA